MVDDTKHDGLTDLADALAIKRSGWHRQENPETGAIAFFPVTAKSEAEWEQRAIAQAKEAERLEAATRPEAKPLETDIRRGRIIRGD